MKAKEEKTDEKINYFSISEQKNHFLVEKTNKNRKLASYLFSACSIGLFFLSFSTMINLQEQNKAQKEKNLLQLAINEINDNSLYINNSTLGLKTLAPQIQEVKKSPEDMKLINLSKVAMKLKYNTHHMHEVLDPASFYNLNGHLNSEHDNAISLKAHENKELVNLNKETQRRNLKEIIAIYKEIEDGNSVKSKFWQTEEQKTYGDIKEYARNKLKEETLNMIYSAYLSIEHTEELSKILKFLDADGNIAFNPQEYKQNEQYWKNNFQSIFGEEPDYLKVFFGKKTLNKEEEKTFLLNN